MTFVSQDAEPQFEIRPAELAAALARLAAEDAACLPLLSAGERLRLCAATEELSFRTARPVIGTGDREVRQDFEVCTTIPDGSPLRPCAVALERLVAAALATLDPPPLAAPPRFNDLIVQRYAVGSAGITPHRDHISYEGLVAIVTLAGRARFFICPDRSGREAREMPMPAGSLLLMRAPGFAGRRDRPFHMLSEVTETRIGLGLRHDTRVP